MRPPRTTPVFWSCAAALLLIGSAGTRGADVPAPPLPPAPGATPAAAHRLLTPMLQDIQALLDQEHTAVEALRQRLDQAHDRAEMLALQLQVEQTKRQTQWSILEVQIRYAQAEGRTADAEQLQLALTAAKRPPTPVTSLVPPVETPPTADGSPAPK